MESKEYIFNDGYVGAFGLTWKTPTPDEFENCIFGAMEIEKMPRDMVLRNI